jgi:hypothetical protein
MQCETVRERLIDGLTGVPPDDAVALEQHVAECAGCRAERASLGRLWDTLGDDEGQPPDRAATARMRTRLDGLLDAYEAGRTAGPLANTRRPLVGIMQARWPMYAAQTAAALLVLALGLVIGRQTAGSPSPSPEIGAMRQEIQDLRHMFTLSLMQQPSATDRLKGVSWSGQIDTPSNDIVQALLDTLTRDPNVNVRLASIDALERFADREVVRRTAMDVMQTQMSPLVQIALIDFMVKVNDRNSVAILKHMADDPQVHEAVRARASWGLQILG